MGASKYSDYADVPMAEAPDHGRQLSADERKNRCVLADAGQVIARAALSDHHLSVNAMPSGEALQYFDVRAKATGG